jgi:hypothetical protein
MSTCMRVALACFGGDRRITIRAPLAIRGHQRPSEAIRGYQRPSEAIRGHQRPSERVQAHRPRAPLLDARAPAVITRME